MNKKLIKLEEQPVYATIPSRPVATITQGKKTNRLVKGINNYFGELKYKLNNNEIPTGKYTIPAVFLAAAAGPTLAKSIVSNPIGFAKGLGWSIVGGEGVNAGSKVITGKTWGENVNELTGLDKDVADYTNVGYLLGPKVGKILKNGFSKVINRPSVYEILPNGKEVKLPTVKKKHINKSGTVYEVLPNSELPLKMLPIKETLTPLKLTNNIFGKKLNIISLFTPDKKSLYQFNENYTPMFYFRNRLNTGGYEKLGITDDSYIFIPKDHRLVNVFEEEPSWITDYNFIRVPTKKFINKMFLSKPNLAKYMVSHYDPKTLDIYINENDWKNLTRFQVKELIDANPEKYKYLPTNLKSIVPTHEMYHFLTSVSKLLNRIRKLGNNDILTNLSNSELTIPGVDYNSLDKNLTSYFKRTNGDEMKARFSQLRDYYGIYDSRLPLTLELWNHAKKHYPFNNDMEEFFNGVTDSKTFLDYMNKIVPVGAATVYGLSNIIEENKENKENEE